MTMQRRNRIRIRAAAGAATGAVVVLLAGGSARAADAVGDPAGIIGKGAWAVAFEAARAPYRLGGQDYERSGYMLKAQGSIRPWLDGYLRLGKQDLDLPAQASSSAMNGDNRFAHGAGIKWELPRAPYIGLASFLDVGILRFDSGGRLTSTQPAVPSPIEIEFDNQYHWNELDAAYGIRHDASPFTVFGGVTGTFLDVTVRRQQVSAASSPTEISNIMTGPIYGLFAGVAIRVTPVLRMSIEANQGPAGLAYGVALAEIRK